MNIFLKTNVSLWYPNEGMLQAFPNTYHPGLPVNLSSPNNICTMISLKPFTAQSPKNLIQSLLQKLLQTIPHQISQPHKSILVSNLAIESIPDNQAF